jgi:hypothetical protein
MRFNFSIFRRLHSKDSDWSRELTGLLVSFLLLWVPHLACAEQTLADLESIYLKEAQKIDGAYSNAIQQVLLDYENALDRAWRDAKTAGDLDGVILLKDEKERFKAQHLLPTEMTEGEVNALSKLRLKANQAFTLTAANRKKSLAALARKYILAQQELQRALVKADRLDDALKVKEEIKRTEALLATLNPKKDEVPPNPDIPTNASDPNAASEGVSAIAPGSDTPPTAPLSEKNRLPPGMQKNLVLYFAFERDENDRITDQSGRGHTGTLLGTRDTTQESTAPTRRIRRLGEDDPKIRRLGEGEPDRMKSKSGASVTKGKNDGICRLGLTDSIVIPEPSSLDINDAITISMWVNLHGSPKGAWGALLVYGEGRDSNRAGFTLGLDGENHITFRCGAGDFSGPVSLPLNTWTHLVASYAREGTLKVFRNGRLYGSSSLPGGLGTPRPPWNVITINKPYDPFAPAVFDIDEVMIFNRSCSPAEAEILATKRR